MQFHLLYVGLFTSLLLFFFHAWSLKVYEQLGQFGNLDCPPFKAKGDETQWSSNVRDLIFNRYIKTATPTSDTTEYI